MGASWVIRELGLVMTALKIMLPSSSQRPRTGASTAEANRARFKPDSPWRLNRRFLRAALPVAFLLLGSTMLSPPGNSLIAKSLS